MISRQVMPQHSRLSYGVFSAGTPLGPAGVQRAPLHVTEILLFVYISSMLFAISAPHYNSISNYFGIVVALIGFVELLLLRRIGDPLKKVLPVIGIGLFVLMVVASIFYLPQAANYALRNVQVFGLFGLIFFTVRTTGRVFPVSMAFIIGTLVLFPIVRSQMQFMADLGQQVRLEVDVFNTGEGLNPNGYGIILNITILLALYEIFSVRKHRKFLIKYVVSGIALVAILVACYQIIFFLGSRQNQLWLFVSLLGIALIVNKGRITLFNVFFGTVVSAASIIAVIYFLRDSPHLERLMNPIYVFLHGDALDGSSFSRIMMLQRGMDLFTNSPIWGHGIEGFQIYSGFGVYSHNMYVEILVNYGLLGFFFFFSYHFIVLKRNWAMYRSSISGLRVISIWVFLSLAGVAVSYFFRPTQYDKPMMIFLATVGGLVYYYYERISTERR